MSLPAPIAHARKLSARIKPSQKWEPLTHDAGKDKPEPVKGTTLQFYVNTLYTVSVRRYPSGSLFGGGPWAEIGIHCPDGEPRHDWRVFQKIKNDVVGPEWEALELFPAESRLVDPSNYYVLYATEKIPLGWFHGKRIIESPETAIAPQRGWVKGAEPPEVAGASVSQKSVPQ
jgi:hypothetical protein